MLLSDPFDEVHVGERVDEKEKVEKIWNVVESLVLDEVKVDAGDGDVLVRDGVDMEDIGVLFVSNVPIFYPMTLRNPPRKQVTNRFNKRAKASV